LVAGLHRLGENHQLREQIRNPRLERTKKSHGRQRRAGPIRFRRPLLHPSPEEQICHDEIDNTKHDRHGQKQAEHLHGAHAWRSGSIIGLGVIGRKTQDENAACALKQLILTADDFGRSPEINAAIERAHRAGFLTQASLMVNEHAADDAILTARRNPGLVVGLHLALCDGLASRMSALTDADRRFVSSPARAGLRYFFSPRLAGLLDDEIRSQCERFLSFGFASTYWDGHAHLHLHPTILRHTVPIAAELGFRWTRLVREPGPWAALPWIFHRLSQSAIPVLHARGIGFADRVYGLRDTGRMSTATFAHILRDLPDGVSELYFHPGAEPAEIESTALTPLLEEYRITLGTYADSRSRDSVL
jgi:chitin disaccharide deacetylase